MSFLTKWNCFLQLVPRRIFNRDKPNISPFFPSLPSILPLCDHQLKAAVRSANCESAKETLGDAHLTGSAANEEGFARVTGYSTSLWGHIAAFSLSVSALCSCCAFNYSQKENIPEIRFPLQCRCMRSTTVLPRYHKLEGRK